MEQEESGNLSFFLPWEMHYLGDRSHKQPLFNLKRKFPEFVVGGKPIER